MVNKALEIPLDHHHYDKQYTQVSTFQRPRVYSQQPVLLQPYHERYERERFTSGIKGEGDTFRTTSYKSSFLYEISTVEYSLYKN